MVTGSLCEQGFPEALHELEARAEAALQKLAARHVGGRILVVSHGGFLSVTHLRAAGFHSEHSRAARATGLLMWSAAAGIPASGIAVSSL